MHSLQNEAVQDYIMDYAGSSAPRGPYGPPAHNLNPRITPQRIPELTGYQILI